MASYPEDERCIVSGLRNTGNSCFFNSVLQALAAVPAFHEFARGVVITHEYFASTQTKLLSTESKSIIEEAMEKERVPQAGGLLAQIWAMLPAIGVVPPLEYTKPDETEAGRLAACILTLLRALSWPRETWSLRSNIITPSLALGVFSEAFGDRGQHDAQVRYSFTYKLSLCVSKHLTASAILRFANTLFPTFQELLLFLLCALDDKELVDHLQVLQSRELMRLQFSGGILVRPSTSSSALSAAAKQRSAEASRYPRVVVAGDPEGGSASSHPSESVTIDHVGKRVRSNPSAVASRQPTSSDLSYIATRPHGLPDCVTRGNPCRGEIGTRVLCGACGRGELVRPWVLEDFQCLSVDMPSRLLARPDIAGGSSSGTGRLSVEDCLSAYFGDQKVGDSEWEGCTMPHTSFAASNSLRSRDSSAGGQAARASLPPSRRA